MSGYHECDCGGVLQPLHNLEDLKEVGRKIVWVKTKILVCPQCGEGYFLQKELPIKRVKK